MRTLFNEDKSAGNYAVHWDGLNESGTNVSSGIYLYRMVAGGFIAVGLSLIVLTYFVFSAIDPSMEPRPDYFYLVITLSFLAGGILLLVSRWNIRG